MNPGSPGPTTFSLGKAISTKFCLLSTMGSLEFVPLPMSYARTLILIVDMNALSSSPIDEVLLDVAML